jgi:hypothetical protein
MRQRAALEQAHHLHAMALRMLDLDQLEHHALEAAAIQVFDEVGDVHDAQLRDRDAQLATAVSGISSTKWQCSSTLSPSTLADFAADVIERIVVETIAAHDRKIEPVEAPLHQLEAFRPARP